MVCVPEKTELTSVFQLGSSRGGRKKKRLRSSNTDIKKKVIDNTEKVNRDLIQISQNA